MISIYFGNCRIDFDKDYLYGFNYLVCIVM